MSWLTGMLKKIGVLSDDDGLNESTRLAVENHEVFVEAAREQAMKRSTSNEHLRKSIATARERATSFERFEENTRRR